MIQWSCTQFVALFIYLAILLNAITWWMLSHGYFDLLKWVKVKYLSKFSNACISFTVGDRAISSKFSTPRVSKQYTIPVFEKICKNGGHFEFSNFSNKCENTKLLLSPQPLEIERFRRNFRPPGYLSIIFYPLLGNFSKTAAIFNWVHQKCSRKYFEQKKILSSITLLLCHNISIPGDTSRYAADF